VSRIYQSLRIGSTPIRATSAALTTLAVLALIAIPTSSAHAWGFPNSQIATKARSYALGSPQGQCRVFAGNVVNAVLAANAIPARVGGYGTPGGTYFGAYQRAGGAQVGINDAQPGDLIQTINPRYRNSDYPPIRGLHTAIVVARTASSGTYVVRDSNWNLTERVAEHQWTPALWAAARGVGAYIWRFGTVNDTAPTDVFFIKTRNTGSGRVEVHSATAGTGYQNGQHNVSWFGTGDQNNGWFQMEDTDGDARPDLVFIKTHNTGTGRVEVHWRTAASGFQSGIDVATALSEGDANNGWFQMVGQDLFFIKTRNTGTGRVEVHSRTIASGYRSGIDIATWFGTGDQSNGWFQMVGGDVFFAKTRNTGSGRVEVHSATAASGYANGQHSVTWFGTGDQNNGWFQISTK
jgi:hypothetical protein